MLAAEQLEQADLEAEHRFLLEGVPWWTYVALRDALDGAGNHTRMTYLEGRLELMSPSQIHGEEKELLGRLLETWADEKDVDLRGFGSTTYRTEPSAGGWKRTDVIPSAPRSKMKYRRSRSR